MSLTPTPSRPLLCIPRFHAKPWGGQALASRLAKPLPPEPIGESWELCGLAAHESTVHAHDGVSCTIQELMEADPHRLLGDASTVDGRFPLFFKFIDARENLSVQVHPSAAGVAPLKHEAWYVVQADPGALVWIGAKDGATREAFAAAAATSAAARLLRAHPARPGDVFYLPSGTPHAIGAGVLVAEVQTPSDVTYRLYDWDRSTRPLHLLEALANLRLDVADNEISQPPTLADGGPPRRTRRCICEAFTLEEVTLGAGESGPVPSACRFRVWMVIEGAGRLSTETWRCDLSVGQTLLLPAAMRPAMLEAAVSLRILEARTTAAPRSSSR